ncbi:MAG: hypothetical protein HYV63_07880 [Candidatus Schekmanbacteria bacterium]|nr:hypothetical protein [Candidatus Schekmanbacteria bacterium]
MDIRGLNDLVTREGVTYSVQTQDFGDPYAKVVCTVFANGAVRFKREIGYTKFAGRADLPELITKIVLRLHRETIEKIAEGDLQALEDAAGPSGQKEPRD